MPPTHPSQADVAAAYRTLIAHETEPKEQDFYRTRLQRLEPRTEPESDDFVTQLAVKQIEGEAAWWRSIDFDRNASRTFESMTGDSQQAVRTGVERVLAHLTAAGRLIPAGGRGLEFSEVEALRSAWEELKGYRVDGYARPYVNQMVKVVGALFPATEPAEVISRYQTMQRGFAAKHFGFPANPVFEDRYTAPDGGKWQWTDELQWELRCYPPAPAVPAGEETKAEVDGDFIEIVFDGPPEAVSGRFVEVENPQGASISVGEWIDRGDGFWALRIPYPSSPVVPAPTETGPWQDISEAPKHLTLIDRDGDKWTYDGDNWITPETAILPVLYINRKYAPFVAAEER